MYIFYLSNYLEALKYFNEKTGSGFILSDFGVAVPFYINIKKLEEKHFLYPIHYLWTWVRSLIPRIKRYYVERIEKSQQKT